jgi:hypothetical protein
MSPRNFTSETGRAAQLRQRERPEREETFSRANPPDLYRCPICGETLSGPPRFYTCPETVWGGGERWAA